MLNPRGDGRPRLRRPDGTAGHSGGTHTRVYLWARPGPRSVKPTRRATRPPAGRVAATGMVRTPGQCCMLCNFPPDTHTGHNELGTPPAPSSLNVSPTDHRYSPHLAPRGAPLSPHPAESFWVSRSTVKSLTLLSPLHRAMDDGCVME